MDREGLEQSQVCPRGRRWQEPSRLGEVWLCSQFPGEMRVPALDEQRLQTEEEVELSVAWAMAEQGLDGQAAGGA